MSGTRGGAWKRGTSQARPAPRNGTCTVPRPSSHQITTAKTMYEAIAVTANSPGEAGGGPKKIYVWIAIIKTPKPAGLMRPQDIHCCCPSHRDEHADKEEKCH